MVSTMLTEATCEPPTYIERTRRSRNAYRELVGATRATTSDSAPSADAETIESTPTDLSVAAGWN